MHDKQRKLAIGVSGNEKSQKKNKYLKSNLNARRKLLNVFCCVKSFKERSRLKRKSEEMRNIKT